MSNIHHNMSPAIDYSLEAKKLWEKLGNSTYILINLNMYCSEVSFKHLIFSGINPEDINKDKRGFNPLDIIYKSPEGGCVYVGKNN